MVHITFIRGGVVLTSSSGHCSLQLLHYRTSHRFFGVTFITSYIIFLAMCSKLKHLGILPMAYSTFITTEKKKMAEWFFGCLVLGTSRASLGTWPAKCEANKACCSSQTTAALCRDGQSSGDAGSRGIFYVTFSYVFQSSCLVNSYYPRCEFKSVIGKQGAAKNGHAGSADLLWLCDCVYFRELL